MSFRLTGIIRPFVSKKEQSNYIYSELPQFVLVSTKLSKVGARPFSPEPPMTGEGMRDGIAGYVPSEAVLHFLITSCTASEVEKYSKCPKTSSARRYPS